MKPIYIYNTLTRQKELFTPITPNHVGMYVCGPTVSGESHLGHARPYITFDVIYRFLSFCGYKVRYVRNITDAGHFEEEGQIAQDKVSQKAILEKIQPMELVQKYTNLFHWAMLQFNCLEPHIEPTATGHIIEQIDMIQTLINQGYAYENNGSVYFDVKKYAQNFNYGILSNRNLDDLIQNSRLLNNQDEKKNNADFALWKKAPQKHLMRWNSPWGEGFPGWHIECSAMSTKYLGTQFDIHGGGMDLQFPHHECEIAQSTIANKSLPAKYWIHNNMITINGKKMGKSYNNVIKLSELFNGSHPAISQPIHPMTIRFFILQTHYSSTLNFSETALLSSQKALQRLWNTYDLLNNFDPNTFPIQQNAQLDPQITTLLNKIDLDICDDFNTAKVLASFFDILPTINAIHNASIPKTALSKNTLIQLKQYFKNYLEDIFGLQNSSQNNQHTTQINNLVNIIIDIRNKLKNQKDYASSDLIRNHLQQIGITIKDNKDGSTTWHNT